MTNKEIKHYHILVRGFADQLSEITKSKEFLEHWMATAVVNQGMKIVIPPRFYYVSDEGNEGYTGSCNLSTSHMAIHIWDNTGMIQADFYTCGDLDVDLFLSEFKELGLKKVDYIVFNREKTFEVLREGGGICIL